VIDGREIAIEQAMSYLKDVRFGAAVTRDVVVVQYGLQTAIVRLPPLPDLVFNSHTIREFVKEKLPLVTRGTTILVVLYCLSAKALQAVLAGLAICLSGRFCSVSVTYGESMKLASIALIPPVLFDFFCSASGNSSAGRVY
jgi:hypothetical protein